MGIGRLLKKLTGTRNSSKHFDTRKRNERFQSINYGPMPSSFFDAVNSVREQSGHDALPVFVRQPSAKMTREPQVFNEFHRNRSKHFDDIEQQDSQPLGTPIKYRRRPVSPEILRPRSSSVATIFRQNSMPSFQQPLDFDQLPLPLQNNVFTRPLYPMMQPNVPMAPVWFQMAPFQQPVPMNYIFIN